MGHLCDVIERPELKDDLRFVDNNARVANRAALRGVLEEAFKTRDASDWLSEFRRAGLPCGAINTIPEVFAHPQAETRGLAIEAEHSTAGRSVFGFSLYVFGDSCRGASATADAGSAYEEVLVELLGYSAQDVSALQEAGSI